MGFFNLNKEREKPQLMMRFGSSSNFDQLELKSLDLDLTPIRQIPCPELHKAISKLEKEWGFPSSAKEGKPPHWIVVEYARRSVMTPEQLSKLEYEPPPIPHSYQEALTRQEYLATQIMEGMKKEGLESLNSLDELVRASTLIFPLNEEASKDSTSNVKKIL